MIACLDLPALPLQLAWRAEPALAEHPVVIIDEDRSQGRVLWACARARAVGVLRGQRFAHALSLHGSLRARVVPPELIEAAREEVRAALHRLSPGVEAGEDPGTFWLDGRGLRHIYATPAAWGDAILRTANALRVRGAIVVGASRFATFAIARASKRGVRILQTVTEERAAASAVPLAQLDIAPKLRDELARLAVTTLGQLVRLPGGGILERFGAEAHRLYQLAAGERWDPLVAAPPLTPADERMLPDDDLDDIEQLIFVLKGAIDRLLARLAANQRALVALHVELVLRHAVGKTEKRTDAIQPAVPTLDAAVLVRLLHLRFTGMPPSAPVHELRIWADDAPATREQLALFVARPKRDLRAADEALASLRAELGPNAVVRAVLRDGHLPEARFGWVRLTKMVAAKPPTKPRVRSFVRRIYARPIRLPSRRTELRNDGWLLAAPQYGPVVNIEGPYIVSGGWWTREIHREYHFADMRRGDRLWVFYDRRRRRWYLHGAVQ